MIVGALLRREVTTNLDGDKPVYMLQVEGTDPDDIQSVQLFKHGGEDYNAPDGSKVVVVPIGDGAWLLAIAVDDGIAPEIDPGGKEVYSTDNNGNKMARIACQPDGTIEIGTLGHLESPDYMVRFNELKKAFDQLKDDFDALVGTYNGHTHPVLNATPAGPGAVITDTTTATGDETTADIDPAKIEEVKIP
jgi:hypothetical protein